MNMIAYLRVSTQEQADSGLGLEAQQEAIAATVKARKWEIVDVARDEAVSGSTQWQDRPELSRAIADLDAGLADGIVVAKLDRLSRSAYDFAHLMKLARDGNWHIVCLDLGVDTSTPTGRFVAQIMAAVAELELDMIRQRTREALQARKRAGKRLGRPIAMAPAVEDRIRRESAAGKSATAIARDLDAEGVPTPRGGYRWHTTTVLRVIRDAREEAKKAS